MSNTNKPEVEPTPQHPIQPHPVQPLVVIDGIVRFKPNAVVCYLYNQGRLGLNELSQMAQAGNVFGNDEFEHFLQLLGFSLDGFADQPNVSTETIKRAALQVIHKENAPAVVDSGPEFTGEFMTARHVANGLCFTLTDAGKAAMHTFFEGYDGGSVDAFVEVARDLFEKTNLEIIGTVEIGALTNSLIIGEDVERHRHGALMTVRRLYWHPHHIRDGYDFQKPGGLTFAYAITQTGAEFDFTAVKDDDVLPEKNK